MMDASRPKISIPMYSERKPRRYLLALVGVLSCRRDKRNLIESIARREAEDAAKNNDLRALYMTTRKVCGIRCNPNRPIRNEDGTVLT